jgi:cation:H+ antiporter
MLRIPWSSGDRARKVRVDETFGQSSHLAGVSPEAFRCGGTPTWKASMIFKLLRPLALCVLLTLPALVLRIGGVHPPAVVGLAVFGAAVVASSFLLAWAA